MGRGTYELWTQTTLISRNQNLYHGGRCLYGYPSRGHVDFQKGQFSRSIARRSRFFTKLQFYPHVGHRAPSRVYFTTSYPLLWFWLSMRRLIALFALFSYHPSGTSKLHILRVNFIFPSRLHFHLPLNIDYHASSPTDEDTDCHIAAYLPTTSVNATVRGLLRQLDHVDDKKRRGSGR